ncbi:hypothetical protein OH77DRAFT_365109 [Trametes cingulata]|nr:hypothetical protein OH77DRAFT_365109 [Trametes cingulata]
MASTAGNQVQCEICMKLLQVQTDLGRHMLLHATNREELMHRCSECSYASLQKSNVGAHYASVHAKLRPYHCPDSIVDAQGNIVRCNHASTHPSNLTRHRKSKHGYDPKKCLKSERTVGPADVHAMYEQWVIPRAAEAVEGYLPVTPTVADPSTIFRPPVAGATAAKNTPNPQAHYPPRQDVPPPHSLSAADYSASHSNLSIPRTSIRPASDMPPPPRPSKRSRREAHGFLPPPPFQSITPGPRPTRLSRGFAVNCRVGTTDVNERR